MNIEPLMNIVTTNQGKLIRALYEYPEGLLSHELAEITGVSNKSATMTNELRTLMEVHGIYLIIEREGHCARWKITDIKPVKTIIQIRNHAGDALEMANQVLLKLYEIKRELELILED